MPGARLSLIRSSLALELAPSLRFCGTLIACHCLAGGAVIAPGVINAISPGVVTLLLAATVLSLSLSLWRYGWRSRYFIARVSYSETDGQWRILTAAGAERLLALDGYYLHPYLVILNFTSEYNKIWRFSLVIPYDATAADSLRQLRLLLMRMTIDSSLAADGPAAVIK